MITDFLRGLRDIVLTLLVAAAAVAVIVGISHWMNWSAKDVPASPPMHSKQH